MKVKKGDKVYIIKGKDRGKVSVIGRVLRKSDKVIVEKANIIKKHVKPSDKDKRGGIVEINAPMFASNVMVICPNCGKITRVKIKKTGKIKERFCRKCDKSLDKEISATTKGEKDKK